jgi:N-methylhydantoinase B
MDPITLEIIRNRLTTIADEMEATLLRAAYSPIVKEGLDASSAIFDIKGQTIAQAAAIPIHLGCLIPAVNRIIELWPPAQMNKGDVYMLNDPYNGGSHLPDIILAMPVFHQDEPFAIVTTMCHHQEMGGMVAGSLPPNATELFQEGLRIPPLQYMSSGRLIEPIQKIIEANVRIPEVVLGDLRAQMSGLYTGEKRLMNLAAEMGLEVIKEAIEILLNRSEELTRESIRKIPDGEYSFVDYLDDDGITPGIQIPIHATVQVKGDQIYVDFTGTSKQLKGPYNCVPSSTLSAVYYVVRAITGPDIPNNSGCFRPISINMPEGTMVNPNLPAPVNSRTAAVKRITDVLFGCLFQAIPEHLPAASCGQLLVMNFSGVDPITQRTFITSELGVGGTGGRPNKDGVSSIDTDATNCMNIPAEAIEMDSPIRILRWRLWMDSAGDGEWRGGLGTEKIFEVVRGEVTATYRGERHTTQPWGVVGGHAAKSTTAYIIRRNGEREEMQSKQTLHLQQGDRLHVFIGGGGGYGNPLFRPVEFVESDYKDFSITRQTAQDVYGVVWNDDDTIEKELTIQNREKLMASSHNTQELFNRGGGA